MSEPRLQPLPMKATIEGEELVLRIPLEQIIMVQITEDRQAPTKAWITLVEGDHLDVTKEAAVLAYNAIKKQDCPPL